MSEGPSISTKAAELLDVVTTGISFVGSISTVNLATFACVASVASVAPNLYSRAAESGLSDVLLKLNVASNALKSATGLAAGFDEPSSDCIVNVETAGSPATAIDTENALLPTDTV